MGRKGHTGARIPGRVVISLVTFVACLAAASAAQATTSERVLVLRDGHVQTRIERFAGATELPAPRAAPAQRGAARRASAAATRRPPRGRATRQAIDALLAQGLITQADRDLRQEALRRVLRRYSALSGTRKSLLGAVIDNADDISAAGGLVPSRLHPVFLTLEVNADWWTDGPLLRNGQRVAVDDSPVVWQYYTGQGIQLQMLANFGKANALWSGKRRSALRRLLDELLPLATDRGGWFTWDYYFRFGGGKPPWTSAISQGTAIQVMGRSGQLLGDPALTQRGLAAVPAFEQAPPAGVRVESPGGPFYAIYSFAPKLLVLNAHAQALVGLYDLAQTAGDQRALGLFHQGDATLQALLPSYDTGKWSMYDLAKEADRSYHDLNTTFLQNLCRRTQTTAYCDAATRFKSYLKVAPAITAVSQRIRTGAPAKIAFALDKISRVGLTITQDTRTVYSNSAVVGRGDRFFTWSRPAAPGVYQLRLSATDLAGNHAQPVTVTLRILRRRSG